MTNKEAIKELTEIKLIYCGTKDEALDLAIKALEQQLKCGCNTCEYYPMKDERPQGECEKCDYRKVAERFVDVIVDLMNKSGITNFEQLSEILKGGAE